MRQERIFGANSKTRPVDPQNRVHNNPNPYTGSMQQQQPMHQMHHNQNAHTTQSDYLNQGFQNNPYMGQQQQQQQQFNNTITYPNPYGQMNTQEFFARINRNGSYRGYGYNQQQQQQTPYNVMNDYVIPGSMQQQPQATRQPTPEELKRIAIDNANKISSTIGFRIARATGNEYIVFRKSISEYYAKDDNRPRDGIFLGYLSEMENNVVAHEYILPLVVGIIGAHVLAHIENNTIDETVKDPAKVANLITHSTKMVLCMEFLSYLENHPNAINLLNQLLPLTRSTIDVVEGYIENYDIAVRTLSSGQVGLPWKKGVVDRITSKYNYSSPILNDYPYQQDVPYFPIDTFNPYPVTREATSPSSEDFGAKCIAAMKRVRIEGFNDDEPYQPPKEECMPFYQDMNYFGPDTFDIDNEDPISVAVKQPEEKKKLSLTELAKTVTKENRTEFDPSVWFRSVGHNHHIVDPEHFKYLSSALTLVPMTDKIDVYCGAEKEPRVTAKGLINKEYFQYNAKTNTYEVLESYLDIRSSVYVDDNGFYDEVIAAEEVKKGELHVNFGQPYDRCGWHEPGCVVLVRFEWDSGAYFYHNIQVGEENVKTVLTDPEKAIPYIEKHFNAITYEDQYHNNTVEINEYIKDEVINEEIGECETLKQQPSVVYGSSILYSSNTEDFYKTVRTVERVVKTKAGDNNVPDVTAVPMTHTTSITVDDSHKYPHDFNYKMIEEHLPALVVGNEHKKTFIETIIDIENGLTRITSPKLFDTVNAHLTTMINRWLVECRFYNDDEKDINYLQLESVWPFCAENLYKKLLKTDPATARAFNNLQNNEFFKEHLPLFACAEKQEANVNKKLAGIEDEIIKAAMKEEVEKEVIIEKQFVYACLNNVSALEHKGRVSIEGSRAPQVRWLADNIPTYLAKHFKRNVPVIIRFGKDEEPRFWMLTRSEFCDNKFSVRLIDNSKGFNIVQPA